MEALSILVYPFVACLLLILIHAYFGIHILERGVIFLDLSLAQFIAVGIALSFLLGDDASSRFFFALLFALLGAFILSFSRQIACWVNIEAFIGVLYVFSLAASILILDRSPHGAEEFKTLLNGNILWILPKDLLENRISLRGDRNLPISFSEEIHRPFPRDGKRISLGVSLFSQLCSGPGQFRSGRRHSPGLSRSWSFPL